MPVKADSIIFIIAIIFLGIFVSCDNGGSRPKGILSRRAMEDVLYDYHLTKSFANSTVGSDNYKTSLYLQYIFDKHHTTEAVFDSTLVWYSSNPKEMERLYTNVTNRMKRDRDRLNVIIASRDNRTGGTLKGDSVDIWQGLRMYMLNGVPLNNKVVFSIENDRNFEEGDTVRLSARFRFPDGDNTFKNPPLLSLSVHYQNDSIIGLTDYVLQDGQKTVEISSDTLGKIKEVNAFFYIQEKDSARFMLIDRISMMRLHQKRR